RSHSSPPSQTPPFRLPAQTARSDCPFRLPVQTARSDCPFRLADEPRLPTRAAPSSQISSVQIGFEEVFAQRREDVYQHDLFIEHCRAVPAPGRKVKHVACLRDPLFVSDDET